MNQSAVVAETLRRLREGPGVEVDLDRIRPDDPETLAVFAEGRTAGIAGFGSRGMQKRLRQLQPEGFEDLAALFALDRPGPVAGGMLDDFIRRRHGARGPEADIPALAPILQPTRGLLVYHEQVAAIAAGVAGFSPEEADSFCQAARKRQTAILAQQKAPFVEGCAARGLGRREAEELFRLLETYGEYGFPRAFALACTWISWQQAWLKAHHPVEFDAARRPRRSGMARDGQA